MRRVWKIIKKRLDNVEVFKYFGCDLIEGREEIYICRSKKMGGQN